MPGPFHGWLYGQGSDGVPYEIINQARLASYLKNPTLNLPSGFSVCDVLDFGGCEAYAYKPPCDGEPAYVDYPGTSGNYLSTPNASPLNITSDITIIADVAMDDWSPVNGATFVAKWQTSGQFSYAFGLSAAGHLQLRWTSDGSTINTITSTAVMAALDPGTRRSVRVDFQPVVSTNRRAFFYTAASYDKPYVQLGATVTQAGATSIVSSTSSVTIGTLNAASTPMAGRLFYAQIRNGISGSATVGGSAILTVDPNAVTTVNQTTFLATTGQVITVNKTGSTGLRLELGPNTWEPEQYISPASDEAPWYDVLRPESAGALGFFVEEWTGLDSGHVSRPVSPAGPYRATLGRLYARERVMKINLLLVGTTEQAVEFLFRWLEATLSNVCSTCATSAIYFRRFCPVGSDKGEGVGELRQVGLAESLTWESDPIDGGSCFLRRASFSLVAADPCIYVNGTTPAVESTVEDLASCLTGMSLSTTRDTCRPSCQELPSTCRNIFTWDVNPLGAAAPIVKLVNGNSEWSMPLRALALFNPAQLATTGTNTCGLPRLGEIYLSPLPPWSELLWDVAARDVRYYDHTTGDYTSGWAFVDANDPPLRRDFVLPCGQGQLVIEPATACLSIVSSHYYYNGIDLGTTPHYPAVTVTIQERLGCA